MSNATSNVTAPDLSILEPYLGKTVVEQISTMDPLMVSIGILVLSLIVATIVLVILKILTVKVAKRTKTEIDDKLLEATQQPVFRLIVIGGLYIALLNLGLESAVFDIVLKLILTLAYLTVIFFVIRILGIVVNYGLKGLADKTDSTIDDEIIPIFHKAAVVVTWAFGIIVILGAWGVDVAPFIAGLGIAGLAISFAMQTTLSNIISGIALITDKTFKVGDKVQLESGEVGTIHEISLRSTRLRTYDNEIVIVPNDNLAKARIKNFTQPDLKVRVVVPFGVEYGNNPAKVSKLITDTLKKDMKGILKDPELVVAFVAMSDSSIDFQAKFWVPNYGEAYGKKLEATDIIYNTLNKNKIGIPFPTQTVYVKK